jgi:hypothetical protein
MAMISQEDRPEFGGEAFQASLATTKVFNPPFYSRHSIDFRWL